MFVLQMHVWRRMVFNFLHTRISLLYGDFKMINILKTYTSFQNNDNIN